MSLMPQLGDGYYDDTGHWQRTKFCFVQCEHCTCQAPGGLFYSAAHDKRGDMTYLLAQTVKGSPLDTTKVLLPILIAQPVPMSPCNCYNRAPPLRATYPRHDNRGGWVQEYRCTVCQGRFELPMATAYGSQASGAGVKP